MVIPLNINFHGIFVNTVFKKDTLNMKILLIAFRVNFNDAEETPGVGPLMKRLIIVVTTTGKFIATLADKVMENIVRMLVLMVVIKDLL